MVQLPRSPRSVLVKKKLLPRKLRRLKQRHVKKKQKQKRLKRKHVKRKRKRRRKPVSRKKLPTCRKKRVPSKVTSSKKMHEKMYATRKVKNSRLFVELDIICSLCSCTKRQLVVSRFSFLAGYVRDLRIMGNMVTNFGGRARDRLSSSGGRRRCQSCSVPQSGQLHASLFTPSTHVLKPTPLRVRVFGRLELPEPRPSLPSLSHVV